MASREDRVVIEGSSEEALSQPPEEVFDFLADAANEAAWNPDVVSSRQTSPGSPGLGATRTGEYRKIGRLDTEIVEYERPRRLVLHAVGRQADVTLAFSLTARDSGTQLRVDGRVQLKGGLRFAELALRPAVSAQFAERARSITRALDARSR